MDLKFLLSLRYMIGIGRRQRPGSLTALVGAQYLEASFLSGKKTDSEVSHDNTVCPTK